MLYTTLKQIKKCGPCGQKPEPDGSLKGWLKLLAHLGKKYSDDEPLSFLTILESNGLDDALWCLRSIDGYDQEIRLLACDYAEHVLPIYEKIYPDTRPRDCITTARKYVNGKTGIEELGDAAEAAADAAVSAARAGHAFAAAAYSAAYAAAHADDERPDSEDAEYDGHPAASDVYAAAYAAVSAACAAEIEWQHSHFIEWLAGTR